MNLLKLITRWIWKSDIETLMIANEYKREENIELSNSLIKIEKKNLQLTKTIQNLKDDVIDVTKGSNVEDQVKEILKQYNP
jgi:hypothetical protein